MQRWYTCEKTYMGLCGLQNALLQDATTCGYPVLTPVCAITTKMDQKAQRYSHCACWGAPISGEDSRLVEAWNELPPDSQKQILELLNTQAWDLQISRDLIKAKGLCSKAAQGYLFFLSIFHSVISTTMICSLQAVQEVLLPVDEMLASCSYLECKKHFDDSRKRTGFETRTAGDAGVSARQWVYRQSPEGRPLFTVLHATASDRSP